METVSTLLPFFSSLLAPLSEQTSINLMVLFRGMVLANGPRTVTACLRAVWPWADKHWTVYENLLRRNRIDLRILSKLLFHSLLDLLPEKARIMVIVDESLVRRYGAYVVGMGMHRFAVRSSKSNLITTPGHKWVVLSIALSLPFMQRTLALPILNVLYTPKKQPCRNHTPHLYRRHRTVGELVLILLHILSGWAQNRRFLLVADGAYGTHELTETLNRQSRMIRFSRFEMVSRFRMDGTVYAQPRAKRGPGRPSVKGRKLPTPEEAAKSSKTRWQILMVNWYGATRKKVKICTGTGLWYKCGHRPQMICWVLVRDPEGKRREEVFFTTDMSMTPKHIVECYVMRWALETTFQETRALLGLETMRNRSKLSIQRSVPMILGCYSVIVLWFAKHIKTPERMKLSTPWYDKQSVTFSDMLAAARNEILREMISQPSALNTGEFIFDGSAKTNGKPLRSKKRGVA